MRAAPTNAPKPGLPLRRCSCGGTCPACRAAARAQAGDTAPPIVHEVLRSSGQELDHETRSVIEPRFGHDFRGVRVHTDAPAATSADAVGADAFTVGSDIVFAAGRYAPSSPAGQRLLAHELAHVVQQSGSSAGGALTIGETDAPAEAEADRAAGRVLAGGDAAPLGSEAPELRRQAAPRIDTIAVKLSPPQAATLSWKGTPPTAPGSDSFTVSTGKGYDPADPEACTRGCCGGEDTQCAPPWDRPRRLGACCTPVGTFTTGRTRPEHNGWLHWTPVEPVHTAYGRGIALHQHSEVTGQAIGHGCIRMEEANARRIADHHVRGVTRVVISGRAKVHCPADMQCGKTGMIDEPRAGEDALANLSRPDEESPGGGGGGGANEPGGEAAA